MDHTTQLWLPKQLIHNRFVRADWFTNGNPLKGPFLTIWLPRNNVNFRLQIRTKRLDFRYNRISKSQWRKRMNL